MSNVAWDQDARWALPAANGIPRVGLEGSGPAGIRLARDQGAKVPSGNERGW